MELHALLIEPSKLYQTLFTQILENESITADICKTGHEGISATQEKNYDLIIMSMQLADYNAIDLCMQLRQNQSTTNIPLIISTSNFDKGVVRNAFYAGASEVFNKHSPQTFINYAAALSKRANTVNTSAGRVLYVEDSISTAMTVIAELESIHLHVNHFTKAEEALKAFNKDVYDLVITDVLLDGNLQGNGFVMAIRALNNEKRNIPILALSGLQDTARKVELLKAGANDFVQKPIISEEFTARVHNLLYGKQLLDKVVEQKEQMYEMAVRDALTGLYNRHYLTEVSQALIDDAIRHNFPLSLIFTDIDFFKKVNDEHGHQIGDNVLIAFATMLNDETRTGDFAARFGGEEFVILLSHCSIDDAVNKAEHIREKTLLISPSGVKFSASFGVAELNPKDANLDALLKVADDALYSAKAAGRNCVIH